MAIGIIAGRVVKHSAIGAKTVLRSNLFKKAFTFTCRIIADSEEFLTNLLNGIDGHTWAVTAEKCLGFGSGNTLSCEGCHDGGEEDVVELHFEGMNMY